MKIAFLTTDGREFTGEYHKTVPWFGTAPQSLIEGFTSLIRGWDLINSKPPELHVVSCAQRPMTSIPILADGVFFHSLHVPKSGWLRSGYTGCALAVRKWVKHFQPDIIHAQGTERDCAVSALLCPQPKILTIHGNLRLIKKTIGFRAFSALWFQSFIEGLVVPKFDGIICISNYTRKAVEFEAKRTWVVPNAVDPTFLDLGEKRLIEGITSKIADRRTSVFAESPSSIFHLRSPISAPPPVVLVVANIDPRKNQNAFIRALDPLAGEMHFLVKFFGRCGEDEYGRDFQSLIAERSWCQYGGLIDRDQLRAEFAQALVLALPTHEDNCPMVVLEAQAAGIPVMASNVGGVPDLVDDGVTGLLTDPRLPKTIQAALKHLLEDRDLCANLARNGFTQAYQRFHPSVVAARHLEIYRELIEGQRNG